MRVNQKTLQWLIECGIYGCVQLLFKYTDEWDGWNYIYLNDGGERVLNYMEENLSFILIYKSFILNVLTIVWGIYLLFKLIKLLRRKKDELGSH